MPYDPAYIERFYDADPEREWNRLVRTPAEEVKLHVHNVHLRRHIAPGSRVLEIGAGPGRFTQTLHELGCRIVVSDISGAQLAANQAKAAELGFAASVEEWVKADICAMPQFASGSFDAVVAYGGPLSYALERADAATQECHRVLKSAGTLLLSAMSVWGTVNRFLDQILTQYPVEANRTIIGTGDLTPETEPGNKHPCHMFRAHELRALLECNDFTVHALSASNALSTKQDGFLAQIRQNTQLWEELLRFEVDACASPGYVEAGTHIIAAATKR